MKFVNDDDMMIYESECYIIFELEMIVALWSARGIRFIDVSV